MFKNLFHFDVGVVFGDWYFVKDIHFWVNDALMALFFFLLGLEIKHSFLAGDLRDRKFASLVIISAVGGAVIPACFYIIFNQEGAALQGWGIPIATDTAFAIGALTLLGNRIPKALFTFLTALAIVDDIFAVSIICFFYTEEILPFYIIASLMIVGILLTLNIIGVRSPWAYFGLSIVLWYLVYRSGVHSTIAGVLAALIIPARPKVSPDHFIEKTEALVHKLETQVDETDKSVLTDEKQHEIVEEVESSARLATTPLQRWRDFFDLPVGLFVLPIFALANAGVNLEQFSFAGITTDRLVLGVIMGLVIGKSLGICSFAFLSIKLGFGALPNKISFSDIIGVSFLCGIGFTMSIYIANLAFAQHAMLIESAKLGILLGSLSSGLIGFAWFMLRTKSKSRSTTTSVQT